MKINKKDITITDAYEALDNCNEHEFGEWIVKYAIGDKFMSYIFSNVPYREERGKDSFSLLTDEDIDQMKSEIIEYVELNGGIKAYPHWKNLSQPLLDLILKSEFEMYFVETSESEEYPDELINEIVYEASCNNLEFHITYGDKENEELITVYAGTRCQVNWIGFDD